MNIPGAYKILLIESGKSAKDVINELGVTRQALFEAVNSNNPKVKTLSKYCKPIGVKVSELIARAESLPAKDA